ncbi:hypothetical protein C0992_002952 [Termitomyces sp. T32_za158]|nr:hypothetical protein C0992_002952 [Termitomyces sp. T32_za158]
MNTIVYSKVFSAVANDFSVPRADQDTFAVASFQKASAAQKAGKFKDQNGDEEEKELIVDTDDGINDGVTKESFAKSKSAFATCR